VIKVTENKILEVKGLLKYFEIRKGLLSNPLYIKAVDNVSFDLNAGEAISLVGESGSGKTTLGKTILRLFPPTGGEIYFKGNDITNLSTKDLMWYRLNAALVQQDPFGALPSFFNISRILEEPLIIHNFGNKDERINRVHKALEEVRLTPIEDFSQKYPHMLSGGQLQRVAIARALILEPELIVADEPVSMLDASVRIEILTLMRELQEKKGISFIYITHNLANIKYFSERLFIMYAGKIVESGDINELIRDPIHPYTQALLRAIPDPDPENKNRIRDTPPGEPPNLIDPPSGCRFHPRCTFVKEICKTDPPLMEEANNRYSLCWLHHDKYKLSN
jgi:peptide/nickel transport system ATP-binding protein